MLIFFEPSIALLIYGLAFFISIFPEKLVKRVPNLLLNVFDLAAIGAGDVVRKQYLTAFFYFLISLIVIFLVSFSKYYFIYSQTFLTDNQISLISSGVIVAGTLIFVLINSIFREEEREREERIDRLNELEKWYQDTAFQQLGVRLPSSFTSPGNYAGSKYSKKRSTNIIGETSEEQERLDREWQDEVMRLQREQEERETQDEQSRQQEESFRSMENEW